MLTAAAGGAAGEQSAMVAGLDLFLLLAAQSGGVPLLRVGVGRAEALAVTQRNARTGNLWPGSLWGNDSAGM